MTAPGPVIDFDVVGLPAPQGSKRVVPTARGPRLVESSGEKLRTWRRAVTAAAAHAADGADPIDGPVRLVVVFRLPPPKKLERQRPATRPDLDKLLRAVCDALSDAGVWGDDGQVVEVSASKVWAILHPPGVSVEVWDLDRAAYR